MGNIQNDVHAIEVIHDPALVAVLESLRIGWSAGRSSNGTAGTIRVWLNRDADQALERIIDQLADLRWKYVPGRTLQLELPGVDHVN